MEVTREALWLLQALCGVERMPAVLVTRPFTDTGDPAEGFIRPRLEGG